MQRTHQVGQCDAIGGRVEIGGGNVLDRCTGLCRSSRRRPARFDAAEGARAIVEQFETPIGHSLSLVKPSSEQRVDHDRGRKATLNQIFIINIIFFPCIFENFRHNQAVVKRRPVGCGSQNRCTLIAVLLLSPHVGEIRVNPVLGRQALETDIRCPHCGTAFALSKNASTATCPKCVHSFTRDALARARTSAASRASRFRERR